MAFRIRSSGISLGGAALQVAVSLLFAAPAFAGRPLTIDDAEPVAAGAYEAEAGFLFSKSVGERHRDLPLQLAYGVGQRFEIGVGWGRHLRDRIDDGSVQGWQDVVLGFKWMPLRTDAGFLLALAGNVKLGTASRAKGLGTDDEDYDLTLIATQQWKRVALDVNLGRTWVGNRFDAALADNVHYGTALRFAFTDQLTWVGEVFANDQVGSPSQWQANAGVQYSVRPNIVLDAALGRRIDAQGPDWVVQFGVTATF